MRLDNVDWFWNFDNSVLNARHLFDNYLWNLFIDILFNWYYFFDFSSNFDDLFTDSWDRYYPLNNLLDFYNFGDLN